MRESTKLLALLLITLLKNDKQSCFLNSYTIHITLDAAVSTTQNQEKRIMKNERYLYINPFKMFRL